MLKNAEETLKALKDDSKGATKAIRVHVRKLGYAEKLVRVAQEDLELSQLKEEVAVGQLANMERDLEVTKVRHQLAILNDHMAVENRIDLEEGGEKVVVKERMELLKVLIENFKVGELATCRVVLECAKGLVTSRQTRVECLKVGLLALESVLTSVSVKIGVGNELLAGRVEILRLAREELSTLNWE